MFQLRATSFLNEAEVREKVRAALPARLAKCALLVEAEAKRSLSRGSKGQGTAKFGDKKVPVTYQSSSPGQPPFLRTGNLRASIQSAQSGPESYVVGPTTTAWYGRIHEFGALVNVTAKMRGFLFAVFGWRVSKPTIHIPPRPFMRPALERCLAKFPEQFKDLPLGGTAR